MQLRRRGVRGAAAAVVVAPADEGRNRSAATASNEPAAPRSGQLDHSQELTTERLMVSQQSSRAPPQTRRNGRRAGRSYALQLYQNPVMLAEATERLIGVYRHQAAVLKRVMAGRRRTEDLMEELLQLQQKRRQLQDEIDYALQHMQALNRFAEHVGRLSLAVSSAISAQEEDRVGSFVPPTDHTESS